MGFAWALILCLAPGDDLGDLPTRLQQDFEERPARRLQEQDPKPEDRPAEPGAWGFQWLPGAPVYRDYLADPLTPRSGSKFMFPIHGPQNIKIENALGSSRTLARWTSPGGDEWLDVGVEGAVFARFDASENWDMDAADFRVGVPIGYRKGPLALKVHVWHLTSHLGDEYIEKTGEKRDDYHKEEIAFGASYDVTPEIRLYADLGFGYYIEKVNERWRGEIGAEWVGGALWPDGPPGYVAMDIKWREETGWDTAVALQAGAWVARKDPNSLSGLRFFVEYYRGITPQTQFLDERVEYLGVGIATGF